MTYKLKGKKNIYSEKRKNKKCKINNARIKHLEFMIIETNL